MNEEKLLNIILREEPIVADVAVWLQGDRYDRGQKTVEMYLNKFAPRILISGNNVLVGGRARKGEENITLDAMKKWAEQKGVAVKDIIVEDKSINTKEQAQNVLGLAKREGWKKIILIASPHHQLRAFLTFLNTAKNLNWDGRIINQSARLYWNEVPGGRNKKSKDVLSDELEKIKKYHNNIATVEDGLAYYPR